MESGYAVWNELEDHLGLRDPAPGINTESLQQMSNIIKLTLNQQSPANRYDKLDLDGVLEMTRKSAEKLRETKALLEERQLRTQEFIQRTTEELRVAQERISKAEARIAAAEAMEGMAEARVASAESWIVHIHDTLAECFACEK